MSLEEITIDLSYAAGVQLVLNEPDGTPAVTSSWRLKEIRRTATSSGAHDFFQTLRRRANDQSIELGAVKDRYLGEDMAWVFVEMGTQAATPELRTIIAEILAPLLERIQVEVHNGIDDIRGGTNVRLFLSDPNHRAVGPWVWHDFIDRVVK